MRYFSLFSGIGGFELGLQRACDRRGAQNANQWQNAGSQTGCGLQRPDTRADRLACVGFSEINSYAIHIYRRHFPDHASFGDITEITASALPAFDLLVGGFPCQAFSIAGRRGGFADTRGTLFFQIARILKSQRPRLCLLENVKGLLSHAGGATFATIVRTLDELGYDLQWQVLNSRDFGVPQNRERVFVVGHIRGTARPEVFPFTASHREDRWHVARQRAGTQDENNIVDSLRRLTPVECERLQGFPDRWTEGLSDTQRYRCLGNAVTVPVIAAIAQRLLR